MSELETARMNCETHGNTEHVNFPWKENPWVCKACVTERNQQSGAGNARMDARIRSKVKRYPPLPMSIRIEAAAIPKKYKEREANAENKRWIKAHEGSWGTCLLLGDIGTGKTSQACGMLKHGLTLNRTALYTTTRKMNRWIIEENRVDKFTSTHYLVIDEIGRGFNTPKEEDRMFEVIDDRYSDGKPVVLVGNVNAGELKKYIGQAASDRVREALTMITMAGESRRLL